jgi:predicted ABC-class ATPase
MNMPDCDALGRELRRIDGRGYPAYKDLRGSFAFPAFTLYIDHVQGDPFAAPSKLRLRMPMTESIGPHIPASVR